MKAPSNLRKINQWIVFVIMTVVVAAIVLATMILVRYLRHEEVKRINLLTKAIKIQQEISAPDPAVLDLLPEILNINSSIPVIVTDKNRKPILEEGFYRNIPEKTIKDSLKLKALMREMEKNYKPFEIKLPKGNNQFVYYDNSRLLNYLQYSPYLVGAIILAYLYFSFWFLRTLKKTDEGLLWAGLAKETAHQIGTPLSSMIGWVEIMKLENPDSEGTIELEKDVERLKTISERFSKIGSVPELNDFNLTETLQQNYDYLKSRISTKIDFKLSVPSQDIILKHNRILLSWVIENLVKNAVDAMKGTGNMEIILQEKPQNIYIDFRDSGCGMTPSQVRNIFKPGFSTKKRGWGLGLSLAKRVATEYHNGDIKVVQSSPGIGTTFRLILKRNDKNS